MIDIEKYTDALVAYGACQFENRCAWEGPVYGRGVVYDSSGYNGFERFDWNEVCQPIEKNHECMCSR